VRISCPHCGAHFPRPPRWQLRFVCPACGETSLLPAPELPPVPEQVRRDRAGVGATLLVLAGLGVLGTFSLGALSPAFFLVAALGIVGILLARSDRETHPVLKAFLGVLAVGGVFVLLAIAALTYLFIQCSFGGGSHW